MEKKLHIVGLGPADLDSISVGTLKLLKENKVILRTGIHPVVNELKEMGMEYESLDYFYENENNFDVIYEKIAKKIIEEFKKSDSDLVYAVPGNPMIAEKSVLKLKELLDKDGSLSYIIHPAVSFIDAVMSRLGKDPIDGLLIMDALDIDKKHLDKKADCLITQVYNPHVASMVKIELSKYVDDESPIIFMRAVGVKDEESVREIKLYELDRQKDIDHLTSVYVCKEFIKDSFYELVDTTKALRDIENGCPWDIEQTHESLKRYMVEEAYEALDAIDSKDSDYLQEELGDVLLQVLIHSQIEDEEGIFAIDDVIRTINDKMIRRHPHVFKDIRVNNSKEVLVNWEQIKSEEKGADSLKKKLSTISKSSPASIRTVEFLKKAKAFGIEKPKYEQIMNEIQEITDNLDKDDVTGMTRLIYLSYLLLDTTGNEAETLVNSHLDAKINELINK